MREVEIAKHRMPPVCESIARVALSYKERLCASLKEAYDSTLDTISKVFITFPWEQGPIPDTLPGTDIPIPDIEDEGEDEIDINVISVPNPRKQEILAQALRLGCEWAIAENKRIIMAIKAK